MLLTETVIVKPKQFLKYYKEKGYIIPPIKDRRGRNTYKNSDIEVRVLDLPQSSLENVRVCCDYCGKEIEVKYVSYIKGRKNIKKDSCSNCRYKKIKEINILNGDMKRRFNIVYKMFIEKGLIPLFDEKYYITNNCIITTPLPYKCKIHSEKIQFLSYAYLKTRKIACDVCLSEAISGENSHMWKGGFVSEEEKIRKSLEYKEWRNEVFKRDNYTCQCCGDNKGHNLSAHHIKNFSDNEELRFDTCNGITLCDNCHNPNKIGSFHHTYGTHNNTKEQLEEYINNSSNKLKKII